MLRTVTEAYLGGGAVGTRAPGGVSRGAPNGEEKEKN